MSLRDILVNGVKLADKITNDGGLQTTVQYTPTSAVNYEGAVTPGSAVPLRAVLEWRVQQVAVGHGQIDTTRVRVTILDVEGLRTASGGVGLRMTDAIVLPDGTTGPILALDGVIDSVTGQPFMTTAQIGDGGSTARF